MNEIFSSWFFLLIISKRNPDSRKILRFCNFITFLSNQDSKFPQLFPRVTYLFECNILSYYYPNFRSFVLFSQGNWTNWQDWRWDHTFWARLTRIFIEWPWFPFSNWSHCDFSFLCFLFGCVNLNFCNVHRTGQSSWFDTHW